ncbi:hypothetical protein JHK82_018744 [Glycine max]|nr:hypothetical protein JHK82_018744 [Glycine max]
MANTCCPIQLEPKTLNQVQFTQARKNESENDAIMVPENRGLCLGATGLDAEYVEENSGTKEVCVQDAGAG